MDYKKGGHIIKQKLSSSLFDWKELIEYNGSQNVFVNEKVSTTPDLSMITVKQLQAELAAAKAEINRLQQQNASLLERLAQDPPTIVPTCVSTAAVSCSPASHSSLQLKLSTKRPHLQSLNLISTKKLPNLNMLHRFLAKRLSLTLSVPLPPIKGLNTFISLYNLAFPFAKYVLYFDDCISTATVSWAFTIPTVISLASSSITTMKLKSAPNWKNSKFPYTTITILWIQTTFETLTMTTSIKMKRSVPHGASSLNV
ncbi:hypothetical protein G6F46_002781 [Rhizopus delemar]|uniref:Uncharacterized protein n=3 Tax=Rhizopus TaxID=4842 RepID=I1BJD0_RHIO9|nr:hypothetical protein RO3G_01014 [Rhizopus delemar RA 99-880]KAG1168256.1 hypothetical protein G6F36_012290 [Rhizopus arrhizus]KAG1461044.1 hypothetical protein G6F55_003797 [Rhizopus delemar]KAG1502645.1 hypothetical protein G6F54_002218 [Rhizopus delemar]KAG1516173.1 hypothetical protein G6F53_002360 [Rhizopus delemar]|eukprot:EIE76310.1 hypothetical protein RO3G_01014 [Rhizopus delemar RA 99-880]